MILCDGIQRAKSTGGKAVRDAIAATKDYDGLTGVIRGFNKGEVVKEKFLSKCRQVFKDGPDKWAVDVNKAIAHARLGKTTDGLQALLEVLASLARCGSGDAARKEGFLSMFRSATKSVISDRPRA
jgi:hypothetical protein